MQAPSPRINAWLSSMVWRFLTRYGRIKYRYLLPVYRLLRLARDEKAAGTKKPSLTLRGAQAITGMLTRSGEISHQDQLKEIIERVLKAKGAVIFLPSIGWDIINTQRSHHLAREFARQGYIAIFDCSNAYDDVSGFKEIEPNLFLFRASEELLHEIPGAILWSLSYNFDRKSAYPATLPTVYDWIDDLKVFPYDRDFLETNHARALRDATIVVSVARRLHEQAVEARPDALYLPNGVDDKHFGNDRISTDDTADVDALLKEGKPIAGYYGAIAEWFDYEMLEAVADLRPDWNFLLIGPAYDLSVRERGRSLFKRNNVRWIGPRKYEALPAYLRLFDVAMIPFLINDITLATSPLKLYEYFAGGKPVITTPMPECMAYPEVFTAGNAQEFANALDIAISQGRDEQFNNRLRDLARENSWTARVRSLLEHLENR